MEVGYDGTDDLHSFKKLTLKRFPKVGVREGTELKFWRKYQFPITVKEFAPVTRIHFSPTSPHDYAVTSGSRVQIYNSYTNKIKKSISRFQQTAYSGCFRNDGLLIAAGSEEGVVKVFDGGSRAILRQFKGHAKPAKTVVFACDGLRLFSGSDDTTVKCWDLSTQSCLLTLPGHEDYIRGVAPSPSSPDILVTASYDHTIRLWDMRCSALAVLQLDHECPVEGVLMFPSGGVCVSCGGQWVRVWELLAGGRSLMSFSSHQKTITALCFDSAHQRLLSASLDKQVKVYSVEDYHVMHSMSYPAPILSIAMAPTDSHLVVGMSSKLLSIKHCAVKKASAVVTLPPRGGSYRYFVRGSTYRPAQDEYVVEVTKKSYFQPYEKFLKTFKYKNALTSALKSHSGRTLMVYSVLQELARRDGLTIALAGLNAEELEPLLSYLARHLTQPLFTPLLIDVCNIITDVYGSILSESKKTQALFRLLKVKVEREVEFQKQAFQLLGSLNTLLTVASQNAILVPPAPLSLPLAG